MFKRLNTGGEALTSQQLRNCTIRMLDSTFIDFIIRLSKKTDFELCTTKISEQQKLGAFDQELVIRFFALKNYRYAFVHDVSDFLTEYTEKVTELDAQVAFNYAVEELVFDKTFAILSKCLGDKSFGRAGKVDIQSNFSVYHFEAICVGLQSYLDNIDLSNEEHVKLVREKLVAIKSDPEFVTHTAGGGKNSPGPLNSRIRVVVDKLAELQI